MFEGSYILAVVCVDDVNKTIILKQAAVSLTYR